MIDRLRGNLFFVPMLFVLGGVLLGLAMVALDDRIGARSSDLPLGLASTVQSARAVVSTIAGATITVAGIAFSVSLLVIQQAAAQYSPRAVHGIFRDSFNKRVMGVVVGTFTYCLVVLRSIRSGIDGRDATVPNLSVGVAVVLGIASILAILAFINHSAHRLEVSELLRVSTIDTLQEARRTWSDEQDGPRGVDAQTWIPPSAALVVRTIDWGWVQRFDPDELLTIAPVAGVIRLDTYTGRFVLPGSTLCTIWPAPDDGDAACRQVRRAVQLGPARTIAQDPTYGARQLADIGLRALSPGVNDPTTAEEAIQHLGVALTTCLRCEIPDVITRHGRTLLAPGAPGPGDLLELAFGQLTAAAGTHPAVCVTLIDVLHEVREALEHDGITRCSSLLRERAELVVRSCGGDRVLEDQRRAVVRAYERFDGGRSVN
jgi:uncharacterized membrane protein